MWLVVTGNVDELTMVYGRYNELVFMGIISWFINITKLLIGGWNHGILLKPQELG